MSLPQGLVVHRCLQQTQQCLVAELQKLLREWHRERERPSSKQLDLKQRYLKICLNSWLLTSLGTWCHLMSQKRNSTTLTDIHNSKVQKEPFAGSGGAASPAANSSIPSGRTLQTQKLLRERIWQGPTGRPQTRRPDRTEPGPARERGRLPRLSSVFIFQLLCVFGVGSGGNTSF